MYFNYLHIIIYLSPYYIRESFLSYQATMNICSHIENPPSNIDVEVDRAEEIPF